MTLRVPAPPADPPLTDPVTGRPIESEPVTLPDTACWIAQRATTNVSSASEVQGASSFTSSLADVLFPPGTPVTEKAEVLDVTGVLGVSGALWRVEGKPAVRRPYVSATLLFISDMQEV